MSAQGNGSGEIPRLISYAVLLVVAIGLFFNARGLPTTRWEVLGAGAFPQLVFGLLAVLATVGLVGDLRRLPRGALRRFGGSITVWLRRHYLVVAMFLLLGVYLLLLRTLGFPWSTFGFLLATQALLAPRTPRTLALALVIALVFSFGLNWVFAEIFNVFLPRAGV